MCLIVSTVHLQLLTIFYIGGTIVGAFVINLGDENTELILGSIWSENSICQKKDRIQYQINLRLNMFSKDIPIVW